MKTKTFLFLFVNVFAHISEAQQKTSDHLNKLPDLEINANKLDIEECLRTKKRQKSYEPQTKQDRDQIQEKYKTENPKKKDSTSVDVENEQPRCVKNRIIQNDEDLGPCYTNGAVATEVPECSELGTRVLKMGGSAIDAAVASTICVGIINSFSSGIGGGGFMLIKDPKMTDPYVMYDFRETASKKSKIEDYMKKPNLTKKGGLAVGVPGEIKGLHVAHQKFGRMKWKDLILMNVEIARGFKVSQHLYNRLYKLKEHILEDEGLRSIYTRNGRLVEPGSTLSRDNYADTLLKLAHDPMSFYCGKVAQNIVESVQKQGGYIDMEDLMDYNVIERDVLRGKFREYNIYTTNMPSSGMFIIMALNIMEHFDIEALEKIGKELKNGTQYLHYHLLVEIFKFIGAKRPKMADPDWLPLWRDKVGEITSKKIAGELAKKINFNSTLDDSEYGFQGPKKEDHGTTHLNIVDKDGMIVSLTSTINLEFGAKFMCPKTGIIFNNEIDDFYVPTVQNAFDLTAMPKNLLCPEKRPFSSAAPFILTKEDETIVLGGAGGTRIPTSLISVIFHLLLKDSIVEAIARPRIHNQFEPRVTYIEYDFPKQIQEYLKEMGHTVEVSDQNNIFTSVQGIHILRSNENDVIIQAASDARKGGMACGY